MSIFKKKSPVFFQEEPVEVRFNVLADFVKDLDSKADYNKAIGAMELVEEWNRDAREEYQEREEARRGRY